MNTEVRALRFALVGNPNCGKTALFNRLTGARAKIANYPGVTVERRSGILLHDKATQTNNIEVIDLPGTYSLFAASPDELVARQVITGEMQGETVPDVLIAVVDASNLKLGLRLVLELHALQRPMILALNLSDVAAERDIVIDTAALARELGIPVVETVAVHSHGTDALCQAMLDTAQHITADNALPVILARDESVEEVYARLDNILQRCVRQAAHVAVWQQRIDTAVMHPVFGMLILFTVLMLMFQAVFAWAAPLIDGINAGVEGLGNLVAISMPDGVLRDFLVNGLIAGCGSVLVFLPQILILFAFILALEDSGYLPRAAFLLDRMMCGVGLSGRSFIPLLSSFACAVPGIMATRTIPDPRERFLTIMVAPLMTCSARLPVYALVIGAFIPRREIAGVFNLQGLVLFALYVAGIVSAALVAWVIRRGQRSAAHFPLLMELPNYRWPNAYNFFIGLQERAGIFLRRVGTIILALSIILWFLATYPHAPVGAIRPAIEYSFAGQLGLFMQPLFAPLGFTWEMCIALIPAMAAREVAVSALATVYAIAGEGEAETLLGAMLTHSWSLPVALAYLAWFVYAPQCLSTIAVVRRETNSWRATLGFTLYLFALAYLGAWLTYIIASSLLG